MTHEEELFEEALRALILTRDNVGPEKLPATRNYPWYVACCHLAEALPDYNPWVVEFNGIKENEYE